MLVRGVRLIDPFQQLDLDSCDIRIADGSVREVGSALTAPPGAAVLELPRGLVAPAFLDVHCHLREPGQPWKERVANATGAAAAGGFGAICAMANLQPPVDTVAQLRQVLAKNRSLGRIPVLQFAACTQGLRGQEATPAEALVRAGASGLSDDGRNGFDAARLTELLEEADRLKVVLAIHPEDERVLAMANEWAGSDPTAWTLRPPEAEEEAVRTGLDAVRRSGSCALHLQHLTTANSADMVRRAKAEGLRVTAEVTPHHLALDGFLRDPDQPDRPLTCNPPLRTAADRRALWVALLDGTIDAVASDHAPHEIPSDRLQRRPAGFSGVQSAVSVVLSVAQSAGAFSESLPRLVAALTSGPAGVLRERGAALPHSGIAEGQPAHLTLIDLDARWAPTQDNWLSVGSNTPFWREELPGRVLATFSRGRAVYLSPLVAQEVGDE
ncbi:MAG: dihydroorotase [Candidatus Dormibacteraeota bacterium]|jgi:dihydroorotase|nr:dihydroorotase [Candidatus Dormibacteraeota bacterium]